METSDTKAVRVLLLHNFLSPYRIPLFKELAARFDLTVWILGDIRSVRNWPAEAPDAGFRMRTMPHVTMPLGSAYNVILLNFTLPFALMRQRPDVIICCAWDTPAVFYTSYYAKFAGIPFVLWSGSTPAESTRLRQFTRPLVSGLVRRASAWLAYGSRAKEYLISLGADAQKTFLAYNTVETESFAKASATAEPTRDSLRARLGISAPKVILYCGNLLDLKGVGDLIEAFAVVAKAQEDIALMLVGSGQQERAYRSRVEALQLADRVVFAGFVQRAELPAYYAAADLLVLPSRSEIWGLVLNEALACGLPVIATDVCGAAPDLIKPGVNGAIVPARDPGAMANAILDYFDDADRVQSMRGAARESIAPFTISNTADAFVAAVRCAMERPN